MQSVSPSCLANCFIIEVVFLLTQVSVLGGKSLPDSRGNISTAADRGLTADLNNTDKSHEYRANSIEFSMIKIDGSCLFF